jgi:hypothetical protein
MSAFGIPLTKRVGYGGWRDDLTLAGSIDEIERLSMQYLPVWLRIRELTEDNCAS